ncbi:malto-oligosyltrehalose trehalohydrolase [Frigoriglobus tundricola]|uniref:malto-oligosyltrehalose trehalohydrolase n=1 Tax=Frigoriglobus tundricola TaxID=2774151 RepID=UPI00148EDF5E|nr:malto-oligosyltrehalose trehalohydrolase [Frigoriglobus tundricola]
MTQPDGSVTWRVWAPKVKRVELVLIDGDRRRNVPMRAEGDGYFTHSDGSVREGQRYVYRLDGAERPDPCSRWQPDGVHRPSSVVFHAKFAWTDRGWRGVPREDLVFYELHVGTFTTEGTFDAIIPRLPELRDLGVTAIEIMPVAQFPGDRNWGYDGVHLFAPQDTYGGPEGLRRLVNACHAHGLAAVLDVVYNHLGPEGNYAGEFGPYYSDRYRTAWGAALNYDGPGSDGVRDFILDNVRHWAEEYHLDGLRLDATQSIFDISPVHITSEIKGVADRAAGPLGWPFHVIAESLLNDVRIVLPPEQGGYGLDAEWNEDFHHALVAFLTGERHGKYVDYGSAADLPRVLEKTFILDGRYSRHRGRRWGASARDVSGDRFVVGIQNHDHVGNRARGERLAALVGPPVQRLAASLMLLSPHLPFLFMGEEYGETNPFLFFCSFGDRGLVEAVRRGRKNDYALQGEVPDPQATLSFTASRLNWSWPDGSPRAGLRRLYRDLLAARRRWPALKDFVTRRARLLPDPTDGPVLEFVRGAEPAALHAYLNLSANPQPLPAEAPRGARLLFSSEWPAYSGERPEGDERREVFPFECLVFGREPA